MPFDLYRRVIRPLAFSLDAETAHQLTLAAGKSLAHIAGVSRWLGQQPWSSPDVLRLDLCGLTFPNPIGLAAGLDLNAEMVPILTRLGFGLVEVGSVSRHPSPGNLRPRLFRLPSDDAIVVNYGSPSRGAEAVAARLAERSWQVPLGVNLVPTQTDRPRTVREIGIELAESAALFRGRCQYLTLNLSCPNVPVDWGMGFVALMRALSVWLGALQAVGPLPPVFIKMPPETEPSHIEATLDRCGPFSFVKGFVFNLPRARDYRLQTPSAALDQMPGAIAGPHTRALFDAALRTWFPFVQGTRFILVGSGGIFSAEDAYRKIRLGASLVQLYTALVYRGPALVKQLVQGLAALLRRDGIRQVRDAIGLDGARRPGQSR